MGSIFEPLELTIVVGILSLIVIALFYGFHNQLKEYAVIIAAIAAASSAITAFLSYSFSTQILQPTERPIISFTDQRINKPQPNTYTFDFAFTNIGKHPATEVRLRGGWYPQTYPSNFEKFTDQISANTLDPENVTHTTFTFVGAPEGTEAYIYIQVSYKDDYPPNKSYCKEYWFKYILGASHASNMLLEEKAVLETQILKAYGNNEERCKLP